MAEVNFLVKKGLTVPKGSAATPSVIFDASDPNCGFYSPGADQVAISVAGSASTPALSFSTDSDTGIYSPGANQLALSTNGTGRLFVDASGNVSVGDVTPNFPFCVVGTTTAGIGIRSTTNATRGFELFNNSTTDTAYISNFFNGPIIFQTNNTERMRLTSTGLGIGTSSPSGNLQVEGASPTQNLIASSGNAVFRMADSATSGTRKEFTITLDNTNNRVDIQAIQQGVATRNITLNASGGNVGVGTTSPSSSALLDVTSTTAGFLPPRMTTAQRDAISSPAAGLMVYNTSTNKLNFYNGSAWEAVTSA